MACIGWFGYGDIIWMILKNHLYLFLQGVSAAHLEEKGITKKSN